jgi:diguanylate cyclase (GGDEF)-like protein
LLKLDLLTLDVVTIVNLLATAVAIFVIWSLNKRVTGLRRSALGFLLLAIGFVTIPLRMYVPGKVMILLPNLITFAGTLFILDGIGAFRGFQRKTGWFSLLSLVYTGWLCYWLFIDDRMNFRVAAGSLFLAVIIFWCGCAMAVDVPSRDRPVYWPSAFVFMVEGIALLFRGVSGFANRPDGSGFMPGTAETIGLFTLNLSAVGYAFGLSMATNLKLQRETERLAFHDMLTDLPNRRLFEERLETAASRAKADDLSIALIYCDIDDFKGINDTLGHEGGDKALRVVSEALRHAVSEDVCLARVGGDEFVLLIENARARDEIHALMERLRMAVDGAIEFGGRKASLRISCGVALYPDDVGSVSDLIRLADAGMYMMKQHGRFAPGKAMAAMLAAPTRSI